MKIEPINHSQNTSFGILKEIKQREYGTFMRGEFKGYNIEVYDAFKYGQFLIYISDKCKNFVKSKLIYWMNGVKKVTRAKGSKYDRMV